MDNPNFMQITANAILRHKDNWKDNPNRYTSLIFKIAPVLTPEKRKELNYLMEKFSKDNHGLRIETAERMIYYSLMNPMIKINNQVLVLRKKSEAGEFDNIKKVTADVIKMERQIRDIAFFCVFEFKELWNKNKIDFENDQLSISDIQQGMAKIL